MKWVLGVLGSGVLAGVVAWQVGLFEMEDPAEAAAAVKANVKPGMTWQQVVDYRAPGRVSRIKPDDISPRLIDQRRFDQQTRNLVEQGDYGDGFVLQYVFSADAQVDVWFNPDGTVMRVDEPYTRADLLQGKPIWE